MAMKHAGETRRRRNTVFWDGLNRLLLVVITLALGVTIALWFYPELSKRNEMAKRLEQEKAQLASEELLRRQREREVNLLETNPEYLEIIARDKLDLMKDGETIYRLEPGKPATPEPKAKPNKS